MSQSADTYEQSTDNGRTWTPVTWQVVRDAFGRLTNPAGLDAKLWAGETVTVGSTHFRMSKGQTQPKGEGANA